MHPVEGQCNFSASTLRAAITLTTKIFAERNFVRTWQALCDAAPKGQFFRGSPRRREKGLPRGMACDVYLSMPYNSSRDAG